MRWAWPARRVEQRGGERKITGRAAEEWIVTHRVVSKMDALFILFHGFRMLKSMFIKLDI